MLQQHLFLLCFSLFFILYIRDYKPLTYTLEKALWNNQETKTDADTSLWMKVWLTAVLIQLNTIECHLLMGGTSASYEVPDSNIGQKTVYRDRTFRDLPQPLYENSWKASQIMPGHFNILSSSTLFNLSLNYSSLSYWQHIVKLTKY
jgi:hypothetical protein